MADWSQLPTDLLTLIGKTLKTHFDQIRFRSVCSTWRTSLPPPPSHRLSILPNNGISETSWGFYLSKRTVLSLSSPLFPSRSWVVKVEQDSPGFTHLVNPLTSSQFDLNIGFNLGFDKTKPNQSDRIGGSRSRPDCQNSTPIHFGKLQFDPSSGSRKGEKAVDLVETGVSEASEREENLTIVGVSVSGSGCENPTLTHFVKSHFDPDSGLEKGEKALDLMETEVSESGERQEKSAIIGVSVSGSEHENPTQTHLVRSHFDSNSGPRKATDSTEFVVCESSSKQDISTSVCISESGLGNENSVLPRLNLSMGFPKTLDLMPIRIFELGFEYILRYINYRPFASSISDAGNLYMEKVALFFDPRIGYVLLTIHVSGKLVMFKVGDTKWTIIEDLKSPYDDVALCNGLFYAVDNTGRTVVVNLDPSKSFAPVVEMVAEPVFGGDKKTMVVSGDELLLVDTFLSVGPEDDAGFEEEVEFYEEFDCYLSERTVRFKIFRLDWGMKKWEEVKDLGDKMLFLGDYSTFSAPASDFDGCKGNCIIFADRTFYSSREEEEEGEGAVKSRGVGVFDLASGSIGFLGDYPGYSKMFWPPPSWVFSSSTTLEDCLNQLGI